jgi:hypothetical protein
VVDKATYHAWYPSQNAPATILIVLVLLQCFRHMRASFRPRGVGIAMARFMPAALCLAIFFGNAGRAVEPLLPQRQLAHLGPVWESLYPARRLRDDVTRAMESVPGSHLIFVKYAPNHCFCEEWVFNTADIAHQRIVYVRPFSPDTDVALARTLSKHDIWVVEPDAKPFRLEPISMAEVASLSDDETRTATRLK